LKNSAGWEAWKDAVRAALTIAYGSKGVPLLYVIREHDAPLFGGNDWEELAISAAPFTGLDWETDRKTVHLFIANNVSEDSDAHAYTKPLMMFEFRCNRLFYSITDSNDSYNNYMVTPIIIIWYTGPTSSH
jgi:hypothetical protein